MRTRILASAATLAAAGSIAMAAPAMAAPQDGLVNVNVGDVQILNDVTVGVAANVLANVCGVQVDAAVIADQVINNGQPLVGRCTAQNDAPFTITD
jgi:hypothetical protein